MSRHLAKSVCTALFALGLAACGTPDAEGPPDEVAARTQATIWSPAYLWAWSSSATTSHRALSSYASTSNGRPVDIYYTAVGHYWVRTQRNAVVGGNIQVAAYGGGAARCKASSVFDYPALEVRCHDAAGAPVNSLFVVHYKWERGQETEPRGAYLLAYDAANQGCYTLPTNIETSSWNAAGAPNRVCRGSGPGSYRAVLPGQGAPGGSVLVTAFGTGAEYCKVASFLVSGADKVVNVRCFNAAGAPADTQFSLSYFVSTEISGVPSGHVWANDATAAAYTPNLIYQANSMGGTNTAGHDAGAGAYFVRYPRLRAVPFSSSAMVTAYGTGAESCKLAGWGNYGDGSQVNVQCYAPGGAPVDSLFTAAFLNNDFR